MQYAQEATQWPMCTDPIRSLEKKAQTEVLVKQHNLKFIAPRPAANDKLPYAQHNHEDGQDWIQVTRERVTADQDWRQEDAERRVSYQRKQHHERRGREDREH